MSALAAPNVDSTVFYLPLCVLLTQSRQPDNCVARQANCWFDSCAADLLSYCNNTEECDALSLFYNGFGSNRSLPSAFFKTSTTSSGRSDRHLNLASNLMLSSQAVLYVKKSSWTGNGSQGYAEVCKSFTHLTVCAQ